MEKEIYLDNAATTQALPEATEAAVDALTNNYANPSSLHNKGLAAEKLLKNSRKLLADYLNVKNSEIIFTSGGTESNNLAIRGIIESYKQRGKHLITSAVEHSSVNNLFEALKNEGWEVDKIGVDRCGSINLKELEAKIREDTVLVSLMHVNNELGTIQPLNEAAKIIKKKNPLTFLHVDGVQALGKIDINLNKLPAELYSISGHKIHGPKGIGALYLKKATELKPLIYGGGQEKNLRSGTENTPGIAGLAEAVKKLPNLNKNNPKDKKMEGVKNYLLKSLQEIDEVVINSPKNGAPHIVNFSIPGIKGETMLHALEDKGIYLSTGSACSSKAKGSRIINACGLSEKRSESALRASLNREITKDDIDYFIEILIEQIDFLKLF